MPGRKAKTNRLLIFLCIVLALVCGGIFTQSSALPSPITERTEPDMFVADETAASLTLTTEDAQIKDDSTPAADKDAEVSTPSPMPEESPVPTPTEIPSSFVDVLVSYEPSPEAASGSWIPNESHWMFLVNGSPYKGWLTDVDGKRYYLDEQGIMQTGWLDKDGNRYYLDLDGIMQTGNVWIDDQEYYFNADGILNGSEEASAISSTETPEMTEAPLPSETPKENKNEKTSDSKKEVPTPTEVPETAATSEATTTPEPTTTPKSTTAPKPTATPEPTPLPDKSIALTFEDGPTEHTEEILNILAETGAKATFFLQGSHLEGQSAVVSRMLELGQELGNHGYTHFDLSALNQTDGSAEISGVDELLNSYIGQTTTLLRPPYGNTNDTLTSYVRKPIILWSIDSKDDSLTSAQEIVDTILSSAEDGSIVLMHDNSALTVEAVKLLLPALAKEGYTSVSVSELAANHGITLQPGTVYSSFH